jgi:invasion protein IalB
MMPIRLVLVLAASVAFAAPGLAQAKKAAKPAPAAKEGGTFEIGKFGDWGAYVSGKDKTKVCYAMSQPKDRAPKGLNRDPAFLFLSHRGAGRSELAVIMGYPLKPGSLASATIGGDKYDLLTKDKSAWLKEEGEEKDMVASLRSGSALIVKGTSVKGNDTTDRYSLAGAGAAIDRMAKECQ